MKGNNITIDHLTIEFYRKNESITAVHNVSLILPENKITGLIGETGCGKSVMGMAMLQLLPKNIRVQGRILYRGENLLTLKGIGLRRFRSRQMSFIPQDPNSSLNPLMKIGPQINEALSVVTEIKKTDRRAYISKLFEVLHLDSFVNLEKAYPFQLSGGMKQRVLTAISICRSPQWILADEPTKGLDTDLRDTVARLLEDIHKTTASGMLIITHDLLLAKKMCHHIAVMYCGEVVEMASSENFFAKPAHPYSKALLNALPQGGFQPIYGETPSMANPPTGCRFHPRCEFIKKGICCTVAPGLFTVNSDHKVRCHLYA